MTIPIALTIAGSDSSGGAGIQADLKTFAAFGVYGASVITALTAQNTTGVAGIHVVPADFVTAQMDAVFGDLDVNAVKIGMVAQLATIDAIVAGLKRWSGPVVLDPVMVATSGDRLLANDAVEALRTHLIPRAALLTPNLPEAAALLDEPVASSEAIIERQGKRLLSMGCGAVLIKGGHGQGRESIDYLFSRNGSTVALAAPRIATTNTHGTGCSLSSAIAAGLAKGAEMEAAVRNAKAWVSAAIAAADRLDVGHGHGPIHHFHGFY
jgi:hydroxymethylpyrimidine/phosphomethylpyrimidine kinase